MISINFILLGIQNQHCAKLKGSKGMIPHDFTKQLKARNAQKRTSLLPASHQRARLGQSKSVLVPHKGIKILYYCI